MSNEKVTIGSFEHVDLPDLHIFDTIAKVDTGAFSGAVHCSRIEVLDRDGEKILSFTPSNHKDITIETAEFTVGMVRSSTGHQVRRYRIQTTIRIQGKDYPITIGLSDRSSMRYEILIGRRFLREYEMLVDVCKNQELDEDGE